jgi:hypothetical protein
MFSDWLSVENPMMAKYEISKSYKYKVGDIYEKV